MASKWIIQSIYNMTVCLWARMLASLSINVVVFLKFNAKKYPLKYKMELITIPMPIEQINKKIQNLFKFQ